MNKTKLIGPSRIFVEAIQFHSTSASAVNIPTTIPLATYGLLSLPLWNIGSVIMQREPAYENTSVRIRFFYIFFGVDFVSQGHAGEYYTYQETLLVVQRSQTNRDGIV
jgi:hypothetical protein